MLRSEFETNYISVSLSRFKFVFNFRTHVCGLREECLPVPTFLPLSCHLPHFHSQAAWLAGSLFAVWLCTQCANTLATFQWRRPKRFSLASGGGCSSPATPSLSLGGMKNSYIFYKHLANCYRKSSAHTWEYVHVRRLVHMCWFWINLVAKLDYNIC